MNLSDNYDTWFIECPFCDHLVTRSSKPSPGVAVTMHQSMVKHIEQEHVKRRSAQR